jgi:lipoprotein-anchoring transpeptidase ErfK/SrfK
VGPTAPITVTVTGGTLEQVQVTRDGTPVELVGELSGDRTGWVAVPELGYGRTYTVTATAVNPDGVPATSTTSFTTVTPGEKTRAAVYPIEGRLVGVAQPITVEFDEPVSDRAAAEAAITVTSTPAQPGGFRWVSDREVRWRPVEYWQANTQVSVAVSTYGVHLGDGVYGEADLVSTFQVGRSMISTVDDTTKRMQVVVDGVQVQDFPVSLGRDQYPTMNGVHVVTSKYESKIMDSSTWGLTGTGAYRTEVDWATRISDSGEFVHAAPWSVEQQGVENVSHGCINVSDENAKWFHDNALPGDPVVIRNTKGPDLPVWDGLGDWQLPFDAWQAYQQ